MELELLPGAGYPAAAAAPTVRPLQSLSDLRVWRIRFFVGARRLQAARALLQERPAQESGAALYDSAQPGKIRGENKRGSGISRMFFTTAESYDKSRS